MSVDGGCTAKPGVYVSGDLGEPAAGALSDDQKNASIYSWLNKYTDLKLNEIKLPDGKKTNDITFTGGYRPMPINASSQRAAAMGTAPPISLTSEPSEVGRYTSGRGLYFTDDVLSLTLSAGDASGTLPDKSSGKPAVWRPVPTHQFIKVTRSVQGVAVTTNYRVGADKVLQQQNTAGVWGTVPDPGYPVPRPFNGTIFSEKSIKDLSGPGRNVKKKKHDDDDDEDGKDGKDKDPDPKDARPALAPFSQITVSAEASNIEISGDLILSDGRCTDDLDKCTKDGIVPPSNVLGVYSQKGSVVINTKAPKDLQIHAMLMSSEGEVTVDKYTDTARGPRGDVTLVGGMVENWYGAFGTSIGSSTKVSGYGRDFTHDRRFQNAGFTPPFFPTSPSWLLSDGGEARLNLGEFLIQQGTQADLP